MSATCYQIRAFISTTNGRCSNWQLYMEPIACTGAISSHDVPWMLPGLSDPRRAQGRVYNMSVSSDSRLAAPVSSREWYACHVTRHELSNGRACGASETADGWSRGSKRRTTAAGASGGSPASSCAHLSVGVHAGMRSPCTAFNKMRKLKHASECGSGIAGLTCVVDGVGTLSRLCENSRRTAGFHGRHPPWHGAPPQAWRARGRPAI